MKRARFEDSMDDDSEPRRRRLDTSAHRQSRMPPAPRGHKLGFFDLPAELKQQIYALVLDSDRTARPSAPLAGNHENNCSEIRYPLRYESWRWPLAYWASRLFRNDLIDVAQDRLANRQVKAELDIMVNGFVFYPTWLHLPPDLPGDGPFDLDVSLRIFSTEAFRSNDGWPRQPGSGFRVLLKLLNSLVQEGPSFGRHRELLAGKAFWAINNLRINITFHDPYTPATHAETSHHICRMLKSLAISGLARGIVRTIEVHSTYNQPPNPQPVTWTRIYRANPHISDSTAQQWRQMGFLSPHQRTLADDYRAPWYSAPRQPAPRLISPLERRDSPVGIIAPVAKNPQQDDYGLITPPTPRANAGAEGGYMAAGMGKRLSTPAAATTPGSMLPDDYSSAMTPSMGGMLDDYSLVMTPVPSGAVDESE